MEHFNINRRQFLKSSSAITALSYFGFSGLDVLSSFQNKKVGLIGCGWYGKNDIFRLIQVADVEVKALCDVDSNMLEAAAVLVSQRQKSGKKPRTYRDYRVMLKEQEFDLVIIGTPDHWHALQAIEAIKAGAHIYLQKPISVDVLEGEAILRTARKHNKTVQIGTQRRSTPHLIEAKKKVIDTGLLGKIGHVEICSYYHMRFKGSPAPQTVPDYFDYEMWCGPAPMRTFDGLPHRRWRAYMEYGNGIMGDMCVHMLDATRWLLDLGWPKSISSTGGIYVDKKSNANITDTQSAVFQFDELNVIWNHRTWGSPQDKEYPWSFMIYGENGILKGDVRKFEFFNREGENIKGSALYEKEKYPEDLTEEGMELHAAPATRNHMLDFLSAINNQQKPIADIEEGHISSASCIIANIAMDLGRTLSYDHKSRTIIGDEEATNLLKRRYRADWEHPSSMLE